MDTLTKLIVGLGNPGKEYERTRHNIGFMVLDRFAQMNNITVNKSSCRALIGDGRVGDNRVYLMKPQTYMNLSGESVGMFLRQKPLELTDIMVVTDDIALPVGRIRLRAKGSAGGHNGLKSIIAHLHSTEFSRLRIGVGAPRDASIQIDHVLGPFNKADQAIMDETIESAVVALEHWLSDGIELAMTRFNG